MKIAKKERKKKIERKGWRESNEQFLQREIANSSIEGKYPQNKKSGGEKMVINEEWFTAN